MKVLSYRKTLGKMCSYFTCSKKKRKEEFLFNCPCLPFGLGFLYPFTILTVNISLVKNKTQDNIMDDQLVCMGYQCPKHFFKQKKKKKSKACSEIIWI